MITISLIWINVVISEFIPVNECELWGMMVSLSHSPLVSPTHWGKSLDVHHSLSPATSSSSSHFSQWPSQNGLQPSLSPDVACSVLRIYTCCLWLLHIDQALKSQASDSAVSVPFWYFIRNLTWNGHEYLLFWPEKHERRNNTPYPPCKNIVGLFLS